MNNHVNRWQQPASIHHWHENIKMLETFAANRHAYILNHLLEENLLDYEIFPNPVKDKLFFNILGDKSVIDVVITDFMGRSIDVSIISQSSNDIVLDVKNLKSGVYFISVIVNSMTINSKFVKI
jgi:hypothetical protein